jgi:arsenate reductase
VDEARAVALMVEHPALIKRPVFEAGGQVVIGFGAAEQKALAALLK